jgi:hypothetical protein
MTGHIKRSLGSAFSLESAVYEKRWIGKILDTEFNAKSIAAQVGSKVTMVMMTQPQFEAMLP